MTSNNPFPRRQVEPLPPPPGGFDTVLGRARARRYRRLTAVTGVAGVFLAGIWGGLAMGGGVSGVQQTLVDMASRGSHQVATTPNGPSSSTMAGTVPATGSAPSPDDPTTGPQTATGPGTPRAQLVRGRVVDRSGSPVVGMYVYTGKYASGAFVPRSSPSGITGDRGRYAVPCAGGPVLLTPWLLNTSHGATALGRWGAEFVSSPVCSRDAAPTVTKVARGATIEGHVSTDVGCAGTDFPLWLWINGDRPTAVRLSDLNEGDTFRVSGLPPGTHVLGARGRHTAVTVDRASTVTQNVTFPCPELPTPTDSPTTTPIPTPDETITPVPDPSASTGSPVPTGSSPPPSGSAAR